MFGIFPIASLVRSPVFETIAVSLQPRGIFPMLPGILLCETRSARLDVFSALHATLYHHIWTS